MKKTRLIFASALLLLFLSGLAATFAISRLFYSADRISHNYETQIALGKLESDLVEASRARFNFINTDDSLFVQQFEKFTGQIAGDLMNIHGLTAGNPVQEHLYEQLQGFCAQSLQLLKQSVGLMQSGHSDEHQQSNFTNLNLAAGSNASSTVREMHELENEALIQSQRASDRQSMIVLLILSGMFALAICLLWIHYRMLNEELQQREVLQNNARRLSARVLQLQDEERRRFSRELHDGLGQNLSVAKMIASGLIHKHPTEPRLSELAEVIEQSLTETRTLSYLLHPPLLDEMGFMSAAKWYVEGFAQRSGMEVSIKMPDDGIRLPRTMELVLFRVLQESLVNIHRHAKSRRAEVSLRTGPGHWTLHVRDYGRGISAELLQRIQGDGAHHGVGLAGMRERVHEQGGQFEIQSDGKGTIIKVLMPREPSSMSNETSEELSNLDRAVDYSSG